jgi:hypothetical protein
MISLKLQQLGQDIVIVFDETACATLDLKLGDTVQFQRSDATVIGIAEHDVDHDARAARSRAILKRHQKTFDALSGH